MNEFAFCACLFLFFLTNYANHLLGQSDEKKNIAGLCASNVFLH
jgi:hypothetical protein